MLWNVRKMLYNYVSPNSLLSPPPVFVKRRQKDTCEDNYNQRLELCNQCKLPDVRLLDPMGQVNLVSLGARGQANIRHILLSEEWIISDFNRNDYEVSTMNHDNHKRRI